MATKKANMTKKATAKTECASSKKDCCAKTAATQAKKASEKTITVSFDAPSAYSVGVAGDFNGWKATPLTKSKTGLWTKELKLNPGTYQYRFIVDDTWCDDPAAQHFITNEFGTQNAVLSVK
ncbi:MAG: glycogen-binding domain-containing protein [Candidatus Omnitrophica bacterium]|nr:glycogen-binding domain-containing protein [Candidatus Omnitrophota bacterium]